MGYFLCSCWLLRSYRPQTLQAVANALGYPMELHSKLHFLILLQQKLITNWLLARANLQHSISHARIFKKKSFTWCYYCSRWVLTIFHQSSNTNLSSSHEVQRPVSFPLLTSLVPFHSQPTDLQWPPFSLLKVSHSVWLQRHYKSPWPTYWGYFTQVRPNWPHRKPWLCKAPG